MVTTSNEDRVFESVAELFAVLSTPSNAARALNVASAVPRRKGFVVMGASLLRWMVALAAPPPQWATASATRLWRRVSWSSLSRVGISVDNIRLSGFNVFPEPAHPVHRCVRINCMMNKSPAGSASWKN